MTFELEPNFRDLIGGDDFDALIGENVSSEPVPVATADRVDTKWALLLDRNEQGAIKPTLHNVETIIRGDPRLSGLPQINEFTQSLVQRTPPGRKAAKRKASVKSARQLTGRLWQVKDTRNGDRWTDMRDFAMRSLIEAPTEQGGYGIKVSDRDLRAAVELVANDNAFHPVKEWLEQLRWDKTPRAEGLFATYMGSPDDAYTRSVSRLLLIAAVTRIYEPAHKWDTMIVLEGVQGKRKSPFIRVLAKYWFGEIDCGFDDTNRLIEAMQGRWILEVAELKGLGTVDIRTIKAFLSRQCDVSRLAYEHRVKEWPRQSVLIASSNEYEYLKDDTGGRRFWPLRCNVDEIDTAKLERNVDQIWAEALELYREMRAAKPHGNLPLYLTDPEAIAIALAMQETRRTESVADSLVGMIRGWLEAPITTGSLTDDVGEDGGPIYRTETCLLQIWCDALGHDRKEYDKNLHAGNLGRAMQMVPGWEKSSSPIKFGRFGYQRAYVKGGENGRQLRLAGVKA